MNNTTSGFVIDVSGLSTAPGAATNIQRSIILDEPIGLDLIGLPKGGTLDLDLTLQSVGEGILVTGTVSGAVTGHCARCLDDLHDELSLDLTELYAYPGTASAQAVERVSSTKSEADRGAEDSELGDSLEDMEDEVRLVTDDTIDLEQPVIDLVGLTLPYAPNCDTMGKGCTFSDTPRPDGVAGEDNPDLIDPRWAALKDKFPEAGQ